METRKSLAFALAYLFMLMISTATAQYDKWSTELKGGVTKIQDRTSVVPINYGIAVRAMANTMFGARLKGTYTELYTDYRFNEPNQAVPEIFYTGTLEGIVNVGRLLNFEDFTDWYTILVGVGGTYTYSETNQEILHRYSNFHISSSIENEFKLSKSIFFTIGLDIINGVNNRPFLTNSTETTNIFNFNAGLTIALGNNEEHADWYVKEYFIETIMLEPTIIDRTVTNNITQEVTSDCNCEIQRYLYFAHDSYELTQDTREAIEYTKDKILQGKRVTLKSYCSNIGSIEYNKKLAENRALEVKKALIGIGVHPDKITIESVGIDQSRGESVFGFGRRVELITE